MTTFDDQLAATSPTPAATPRRPGAPHRRPGTGQDRHRLPTAPELRRPGRDDQPHGECAGRARGGHGDRIALLSHNNSAYVVTCSALARLGAVARAGQLRLGAAEVAFVLEHSGAVGVIVEDALVPVAAEALETAGLSR